MSTDPPEERLLRLIKGQSKKRDEILQENGCPKTQRLDFFKLFFTGSSKSKHAYLETFNKVLLTLLIAMAGYLLYTFFVPPNREISSLNGSSLKLSVKETIIQTQKKNNSNDESDFKDYSKTFGEKKVFGGVSGSNSAVSSGSSPSNPDIYKRFNLVGVIEGAEPQAIIEDKEFQKTRYLIKGQSIEGIFAKEIIKRKVVLVYEGEEVTLTL